ncbi:MAG: glycosyltransferase family 4 protein [Chitinophagales bacterium]|nr:glycosyltransferase family 4 protein [Chitinophagales bacterium]MDW8394103.1 glycosyltransferase family 4 protein [Chitinophagales bacterium]
MNDCRRMLFIGPHRPDRNPSQRYRMEQFFPYLMDQGIAIDYSWYLSETDDAVLYRPGYWLPKAGIVAKAAIIRLRDVFRRHRYQVVFVQREAFLLGTALFERLLRGGNTRLVFDFDDAIWLGDTSDANRPFQWLKRPQKLNAILRIADLVLAGNDYLADYARQYTARVVTVPTVVDTDKLRPRPAASPTEPVCIGWTGSHTTIRHFQLVVPALKAIQAAWGSAVRFLLISNEPAAVADLPIEFQLWHPQTEAETTQRFDIGLMPLPDDEWSKGKCGLKALQYMAVGAVPVVSPVGVNKTIVIHGISGFWAEQTDDWVNLLTLLISNPGLRQQIGQNARLRAETHYSVKAMAPKWLELLLRV